MEQSAMEEALLAQGQRMAKLAPPLPIEPAGEEPAPASGIFCPQLVENGTSRAAPTPCAL